MANDAYHILIDINQYQFYPLSYNVHAKYRKPGVKDSYLQIQLFNIKVTIHVAYTTQRHNISFAMCADLPKVQKTLKARKIKIQSTDDVHARNSLIDNKLSFLNFDFHTHVKLKKIFFYNFTDHLAISNTALHCCPS